MRIWTSRSSTASHTRALALVLSVLLVAMLLAPAGIAFAENGEMPEIRDECPAPCAGGLVIENPDFQEQSYDIPGYPGKKILVRVEEGDGAWVSIDSEVGVTRVSLGFRPNGEASCAVYDFGVDNPVFEYSNLHTPGWQMPIRIEICFAGQDEGTPEPEPEPEAQPTPQPAPEVEAEAQVVVLPRTGGDGLVLLGAAAIFGSGGVAIRTLSRRRKH